MWCTMYFQFFFLFLCLAAATGSPYYDESENGTAKSKAKVLETVRVDIYYESLCPSCKNEYVKLPNLVNKIGSQLKLLTYPYGNAKMYEESGQIAVQCQHGEEECYGNMLHACAMEHMKYKVSDFIPYIACMTPKDSTDAAADECGKSLSVDSEPIKSCAKGPRGHELLVRYGKETEKQKEKQQWVGVPDVVINGRVMPDNKETFQAVCEAFKHPPPGCNQIS